MEEGGAPSALEDGSALAQRVPSDMEEGCAPSALEDGSALRAPPTVLALALGVCVCVNLSSGGEGRFQY